VHTNKKLYEFRFVEREKYFLKELGSNLSALVAMDLRSFGYLAL
jgi:hypothetical protein